MTARSTVKMNSEEIDFSRICRVCCTEGASLPLFRVNLHRKVMSCAAVQVWQNDGLPGQICKRCVAKLHISFQFKKQCERSDIHLRRCRDSGKFYESKKSKNMTDDTDINEINPLKLDSKNVKNESVTSLPISNDCNFSNCSIQQLDDNREYESIKNIVASVDVPIEQQSLYNSTEILVSVGVDLPIRDQFDLSGNFPNHPLSNLTLDSTFANQMMSQSHSVAEQILSLETLTDSNQLQPLQRTNNQVFELSQIDISPITEEKEMIVSKPEQDKQNKVPKNISIENLHCPICNKSFDSASKLNRHNRTHSDEILYRCDICHKGFIHGGNFKVHLRTHNDERPFACHMCNRRCRQQQDLDKHLRTHTGERPHACSVCQKAFKTSSNLIAHERIHRGEKPYICMVCQKAFCQSSELTTHIRTHTGEKSHICPICNKGFNGSSKLVAHMRIHTGERPYICVICNKGFTQASCLTVHSRKHAAKGSFLCLRCSRTFQTFNDLQLHAASHSPINFSCPEPGCSRHFCRRNDLLRHTKISHSK